MIALPPCFDGNQEIGIGRQGAGTGRKAVVMNKYPVYTPTLCTILEEVYKVIQ